MSLLEGFELSEELPVAFGNVSGAIYGDEVTVMRECLQNDTRLVPLLGCVSSLVLEVDMVTRDQVGQLLTAFGQALNFPIVPDHECLLPLLSHVLPLLPGCELPNRSWNVVPQLASEDNFSWRHVGEWIRLVTVDEDGTSEPVIVKITIGAEVVLDQPFSTFHTNLRTLVRPREVS